MNKDLFEMFKALLPNEIVMTAKAYREPMAIERTMHNIFEKTKDIFKTKYPKQSLGFIDHDFINQMEDIIYHRILVK